METRPLTSRQQYLAIFFFVALCLIYLATVFRETPFIHQEVVGQAFWYTCHNDSFLHTLFDPSKNDQYPGRFRYVEYATEALYWNLMSHGLLPRTLFDLFSIGCIFIQAFLFFRIARRRVESLSAILLLVSVFVLGIPSFMVAVFHYRKAKVLTGLWLLLIIDSQDRKLNRWIVGIYVLGFLTDPFFILLAPVVSLCCAQTRSLPLIGFCVGTAIGTIAVLNGVIGPLFNPSTALLIRGLRIDNPVFLQWANIPSLWAIVTDTMGMLWGGKKLQYLGWLLIAGLTGLLFLLRHRKFPYGFLLAFLLCLPLSAYLVRPHFDHIGVFATYYGFPVFVLFCLACIDLIKFPKLPICIALLIIFFLHQKEKGLIYDSWRWDHFNSEAARKIYDQDVITLRDLQRRFNQSQIQTQTLDIDLSRFEATFPAGYGGNSLGARHSNLAYVFIPLFFSEAIQNGKLRLIETTKSGVVYWPVPCKTW